MQQRLDLAAEIVLVDLVHLGGDLERDTEPACDTDGAIGTFFGRYAAEECYIPAFRVEGRLMQVDREAMVHGGDEVGGGQRLALIVGNRHQRQIAKTEIEP